MMDAVKEENAGSFKPAKDSDESATDDSEILTADENEEYNTAGGLHLQRRVQHVLVSEQYFSNYTNKYTL